MLDVYDNRILCARENTTFALDAALGSLHASEMDSEAEIRAALQAKLAAKEITQGDIAAALGVQQPNAQKLFTPATNGKLRKISFDEGLKLIEKFGLSDAQAARSSTAISAEVLAQLLHALGPSIPKKGISESASKALAVALKHGLELLQGIGASDPTEREIAMAVHAAVSRFREASAT